MRLTPVGRLGATFLCLLASAGEATAQRAALADIGDPLEDRRRMEQALGRVSTDGFLIRRTRLVRETEPEEGGALTWYLVMPDVLLVWNSELAQGGNDGSLWAGRGLNSRIRGGVALSRGPVDLVVAPELTYSQNLGFEVFPYPDDARSAFASPFYRGRNSADLPMRFGTRSLTTVHPGQTTLSIDGGALRVGASTADQWWGPGIRNGLVLSDNAPGFAHLFLETASPLRTPLGSVEARWLIGTLLESPYFDYESTNDRRSVSAAAVTFRPAAMENLTVGASRVVVAPLPRFRDVADHVWDVFLRWDPLPDSPNGTQPTPTDGLYSLFARWVDPSSGVEVYGEWAHEDLPSSMREFLTAPQHAQAWTVGAQWVQELADDRRVRIQLEGTTLEQTQIIPNRLTPPSFYTGRATAQGFTHRGQVLGAEIGPGGQRQWLAVDYLREAWSAGGFVSRVRRNNDRFYAHPGANFVRHDVAWSVGTRGDFRADRHRVFAQLSVERRLNYLFQNGYFSPGGFRTVDLWNVQFELSTRLEVLR